jgi:hypothetical protein
MAAIEIECGKSHTEKRILSFSEADRDRIVQNFPDKIEVSGAGSVGQEFALRPYIKAILDQVQPPTAKIAIAVRGDPDDLDTIEIDDIQLKVTGNTSGTFKVADVEISYAFDADILPSEMTTPACECEDGEGRQRSRTFKCTWDIEISIVPGIGGMRRPNRRARSPMMTMGMRTNPTTRTAMTMTTTTTTTKARAKARKNPA